MSTWLRDLTAREKRRTVLHRYPDISGHEIDLIREAMDVCMRHGPGDPRLRDLVGRWRALVPEGGQRPVDAYERIDPDGEADGQAAM